MTRSPRRMLIGGGARSGKSSLALHLARTMGQRRAFLATAQAYDAEMAARIERHQQTRGGDFTTVEEPIALGAALEGLRGFEVVVVDCLTLWMSNVLIHSNGPEPVIAAVDALIDGFGSYPFDLILVTNEVGLGIVPESALGRMFRDLAGTVHQRLARGVDEVYFAVLGVILRLRPGPIEVVSGAQG